jgi:hypothetical protein
MQKESGLHSINNGKNMYHDVQDFRWLKKMQSPHWSLLDVESGEGGAVGNSECQGVVAIKTKEAEVEADKLREAQRTGREGGGGKAEKEEEEDESEDEL